MQEEEVPSYVHFYQGTEASPKTLSQHCDPAFLEALVSDSFYFASRASHELAQVAVDAEELPAQASRTANILGGAITQCRRLQACQDLFPSASTKGKFFLLVGELSVQLAETTDYGGLLLLQEKDDAASAEEGWHVRGEEVEHQCQLPAFFLDKVGGKNKWNNWLDNSAKPMPGWIAIQQKIPRFGDKLIRRLTCSYEAVEKDFIKNDLIFRDPTKPSADIPRQGEGLKHMTWSGSTTISLHNLGFAAGARKEYDRNGTVTLEHLSQVLHKVESEQWRHPHPTPLEVSNCPYFRFAVAYRS